MKFLISYFFFPAILVLCLFLKVFNLISLSNDQSHISFSPKFFFFLFQSLQCNLSHKILNLIYLYLSNSPLPLKFSVSSLSPSQILNLIFLSLPQFFFSLKFSYLSLSLSFEYLNPISLFLNFISLSQSYLSLSLSLNFSKSSILIYRECI